MKPRVQVVDLVLEPERSVVQEYPVDIRFGRFTAFGPHEVQIPQCCQGSKHRALGKLVQRHGGPRCFDS